MSSEARSTVGLLDLAAKLPSMITEVPILARGAAGLTRKPSAKESIGLIFQKAAHAHPSRPFIRFEGHATSYAEANELVNRYADVLRGRGVDRGDVVGVLAKNTPEALLIALAAVKLGAAAGMLNYNQRDDVLAHSLTLLDARVLVVADECEEALESLPAGFTGPKQLLVSELADLAKTADPANPAVTAEVLAKEKAFYIFTSGTTGMPKASLMTHFRWLKSMSGLGLMGVRLRGSDTLYCCLPLYHNNALTVSLSSVLASGATIAIGRQFSASRFWDDIALNKATAFTYIGELCRYLLNQPVKPTDSDNAVRLMVGNGLRPEIWAEFTQRFGIPRVAEFYGASECNIAFVNALNVDKTAGICPLPHAVVEFDEDTGKALRGADGRLRKVSTGQVGLLLSKVTDRAPFDGYTDEAASNSKLVRGGFKDDDTWFDTGDLVRKQGWGHVAFVDRLGDTFRWKGENVATTEVEGALSSHPAVEEAVVYGVEIPGTDGRAGMAAVKLRDGQSFEGSEVAAHLYGKLPNYAVPLFIRIVDSLEHTSTFKSRKVELRNEGYDVGADTLHVLEGREGGYVDSYDEYVGKVAAGSVPKG
ncbi:long-chain-acyl-CoA synthetase [Rhodococcus sp. WS1]|uniref:long-chain-acyl-CoA synthetase n=1 Tax=unclassified Rhodococcus (in: high G+C Gram-positive bacteria) TaxID=192944 RepID=UPI0011447152|nr:MULTISPECIES: long-chain-acyl-CoA synthetase [unclassified Rhodococcus (in: high G+C Gram-positive bacteria)]ROZ56857.1 long-chain-acyl-CoA synthetase [Rhodococcus sp. WS1]TQC41065.1 long-chain-acyl-CoA synthetase [Rhodococcus sp. WS7]